MKTLFVIILFFFSTISIAQLPEIFIAKDQAKAPDYSLIENWSALPFQKDNADIIPNTENWISDSLKKVDVFFIHPTMYKGNKATSWTADLQDKKTNKKVDNKPIKYQASVFNKTARVYAPRYRQAHLDVFDDESKIRYEVLDFAYQDVKNAFEYFLKHYNKDRPIIIASHSQGTVHARRLIKEYFDTAEKKQNLVCAYLVGFGVYPKDYRTLMPCKNAEEINCYVTWSSFLKGFNYPLSKGDYLVGETSTNPISWKMDTIQAESKKSIFINVKAKKKYRTKAKITDNMLWIDTKLPFVKSWKIMHLVDYNLFWYNIRENVALRTKVYFELE